MKLSYEGIGQWAASFSCNQVSEGELVKISGNGTVASCAAGDAFCGMVLALSHDDACSVALGGMMTAGYSGTTVPATGWTILVSDGNGGVKTADSGRSYLVVDVDTTAKTVTFAL
jgi:hypothetical protein